MGAKKKARSRQSKSKKAGKKQDENRQPAIAAQPSAIGPRPLLEEALNAAVSDNRCPPSKVFHQEDDVQGLLEIKDGNVEPRSKLCGRQLAQYLPRTIQDIKEGKLPHGMLSRALVDEICRKNGFTFATAGREFSFLCHRLAEKALNFVPNYRALLSKKMFLKFVKNMRHAIMTGDSYQCWISEIGMRRGIDNTCLAWGTTMDRRLCGGIQGDFCKNCPLFRLSRDDIRNIQLSIADEADWDEDNLLQASGSSQYAFLRHAEDACFNRSSKNEKNTCWECQVTCEKLLSCSLCKVANYCCQVCQEKAWKGGHKQHCKSLAVKWYRLEDSIGFIQNRKSAENTRITSDYELLTPIHTHTPLYDLIPFFQGLKGPSTEIFYKNFHRVLDRQWWVIEDPLTMDEYMATLMGTLQEHEDDRLFHQIGYLLSYDFFHFGANPSPDAVLPIAVTQMMAKNLTSLKGFQDIVEQRMPAQRFINLYYGARWAWTLTKKESDWDRRHDRFIHTSFRELRLHHQKSNGTKP